jgi:hypothetical protein
LQLEQLGLLAMAMAPIRLHTDVENHLMRVDHCHFEHLYQTRCIWANGRCYGVADHNVMENRSGIGSTEAFLIQNSNSGHDAWADFPWYGTDKFFFIEDNTVEFGAVTDSDQGGRFVVRHNYLKNGTIVTDHGTEGTPRGVRCKEVYNNTFYVTATSGHPGGQRSGTCLWHDNTVVGSAPLPSGVIYGMNNNREGYLRAHPIWGIADGTSVWEANDTEGNGTFVEGHAPHLFDSGSATSWRAEGNLTDNTKRWTTNQWARYSIKNTNRASASYGLGSYIISNTATTITYANFGGRQGHLIFNAGDTYQIHRVLVMMDQNGRGKTDLITGFTTPINTTTGRASYAHSVLEPCYSWNNVYAPTGQVLGLKSTIDQPTTKEGIDYFNLGNGFPANTTPSAVSLRYTAALNGVAYSGLFTYPHPLVSGVPPTPTPTATATPTATPRPTVTTNPATNIASFAAALNGSVNPRGSTTTVYFQWGTTTSYGHNTPMQTQTGNTSRPITANISGLSASRLYHFRIVATNGGGTSFGSDRTFTTLSATGPPVVTTNPATNVTTSSARLNGSLDPHGSATTVYFQWGATTSYGHNTPMQTQTGNTSRPITANISGLSANHLYHFRIVATTSAGLRVGSDRTFNTP